MPCVCLWATVLRVRAVHCRLRQVLVRTLVVQFKSPAVVALLVMAEVSRSLVASRAQAPAVTFASYPACRRRHPVAPFHLRLLMVALLVPVDRLWLRVAMRLQDRPALLRSGLAMLPVELVAPSA